MVLIGVALLRPPWVAGTSLSQAVEDRTRLAIRTHAFTWEVSAVHGTAAGSLLDDVSNP